MSVRGFATGARWEDIASELTADVAAGVTTLPLENLSFFDDDGDTVQLNGELLTSSSIDEDADTIALVTGPAADAATGDKVYVYRGGQVKRDYVLVVDVGGDDPALVIIPFAQRSMWPEGEYTDPVEVILSDDYEKIEEVPGRTPTIDPNFLAGTYIHGSFLLDTPWAIGLAGDGSFPDIQDWDVNASHSPPGAKIILPSPTGRFLIEEPGLYLIILGVGFGTGTGFGGTESRGCAIRMVTAAGTVLTLRRIRILGDGVNITTMEATRMWPLHEGDSVFFEAVQDSGATIDLLSGFTNFSIYKLANI